MERKLKEKDIEYIKEHGGKETDKAIAKALGCSHVTVWHWRQKLGLPSTSRTFLDSYRFIEEHYRKDMTANEIGKVLGLSASYIYTIASSLELTKTYDK